MLRLPIPRLNPLAPYLDLSVLDGPGHVAAVPVHEDHPLHELQHDVVLKCLHLADFCQINLLSTSYIQQDVVLK